MSASTTSSNNLISYPIRSAPTSDDIQSVLAVYDYSSDSTNSAAKRFVRSEQNCDYTLFIAQTQTQGRGRKGNVWSSELGGLYMSIILPCVCDISNASLYSTAAGVCVQKALCSFLPTCRIKWPNDMLVSNKKLCGLMCELVCDPSGRYHVIIGIGVNVNSSFYDSPLRDTATSIRDELGHEMTITDVCKAIVHELMLLPLLIADNDSLIQAYTNASCIVGKDVKLLAAGNVEAHGKAVGFDNLGRVLIQTEIDIKSFDYGEISLRLEG